MNIIRFAATGLYLSITCAEDIPFADEPAEYEQGRGTFLADHRARSHFEACRRWPRGSVPDDFHEPVVSDVNSPRTCPFESVQTPTPKSMR